MKHFRFFFLFSALFFLFCAACSTEGDIRQIIGRSVEAPVFLECRPLSSTELVFRFSTSVRVVSLNFDPPAETGFVEEGRDIKVSFRESLEEGKKITADILVEDSGKNTLNVIVPFRARNDRMPPLIINEVRTENSKPKAEYVEFFAPEPGNLGAIRLFAAVHSLSEPVYEFPPAEVKAGDYIVLHLRTPEEGCVNESGGNPSLSRGVDAHDEAFDFWIPGNTELLRKTDALWLLDQDDRIIDAVIFSEKPDGEWDKKNMSQAAEYIGRGKAWLVNEGGSSAGYGIPRPADAVFSGNSTNTQTLCRDEIIPPERRAENWYTAATSNATPGRENSVKRFIRAAR